MADEGWERFERSVREAYATPIPPGLESRQIQFIIQAARQTLITQAPRRPLRLDRGRSAFRLRMPRPRRLLWANLVGSVVGKVVIVATAAAATTTGLAATGTLPDPVQTVVSDAADTVGVGVPGPSLSRPEVPRTPPSRLPAQTPAPHSPPATVPDLPAPEPIPPPTAEAETRPAPHAPEQSPPRAGWPEIMQQWLFGAGRPSPDDESWRAPGSSRAPSQYSPSRSHERSWDRPDDWSWSSSPANSGSSTRQPNRSSSGRTPRSW